MTGGRGDGRVGGLLLFPGAGAGRDAPALVAIERALDGRVPVARADFPYRRAGRRAPDRPAKLVACVREEAVLLAEREGLEGAAVALGGRSMGGRMCSMAVAEGLPAAALVLVSYPLHPPGSPDRLRVDHFPGIAVPCLFVSGTRDPFGTPDELTEHTAAIAGPVTHEWVDGARHDLRGRDAEVAAVVRDWLVAL
ncbi:MAG TPA: alpha/beta family hydrolase [Acidimicrobiales bacterium]|nr:alpha/beta family hydrolase [Acidimicrobiales bacterium]